MKTNRFRRLAVAIAMGVALASLPAFGQDQQPEQQTGTSPGVARVSVLRGDVSIMRGDSGEWVAATVNTPVVPGDTIATGAGSHAELQLDYANVLRLGQNAQVKIADMTRSRLQLQAARGTVALAVMQGNQTSSEIDTPNVAVQPLQPGTYRIDVNSDDLSVVTVRDGQAQISTPQGSTNVSEGQQITVQGAQNPQYQIANAQPPDDFDRWNSERNQAISRPDNYSHVNQYYTGAQDLGSSGRWQYVPGYDWCWTPAVDAGWVPYSNGRWVWEPYYGWTWVSYEPWGWAPYHYGRWFFYGSSWFWWPGAVSVGYYQLWAPAYVSFIGFGFGYHNFSFGFGWGFNSIGWCPLGPRDDFHRWWGRGDDHSYHVVNINNYYGRGGRDFGRDGHGGYGRDDRGGFGRGGRDYGSNLDRLMSDPHVRRSITTMPANRFGREAVYHNRQGVSDGMLKQASLVRGTLPVVPGRGSLTAANRAPVVPMSANRGLNNTRFYSRNQASSFSPNHSFNQQAASIRQMVQNRNGRSGPLNGGNGRGFGNSNSNGQAGRGLQASGVNANPGNPRGLGNAGTGRTSAFGNGRGPNTSSAQAGNQGGRQGWSRFGAPVNRQGAAPRGEQPGSLRAANGRNGANAPRTNASWSGFGNPSSAAQNRAREGNPGGAPVVRANPQQARQNSGARAVPNSESNRGGWQTFSRPGPQSRATAPRGNSQTFNQRPSPSGNANRGGNFRTFTPQSTPRNLSGSNYSRPAAQPRNDTRSGWSRFSPQPQNRGGAYGGGNYSRRYGSGSYSRPPLNLDRPIVTQRRSESAPRGNPGYGGRGYSGGSAPRYSPNYGGGSYRAPAPPRYSGGGGGSYRGSSAPHYSGGGGGYRGGGGGGGYHSGGGGSHGGGGGGSHGGGGGHHR